MTGTPAPQSAFPHSRHPRSLALAPTPPPRHPHPRPCPLPPAQGFYGRSVVWSGVRYRKRHGCVHSLEQLPTSRNLRGADRSRTMWSEPAEWLERVAEVAA